jgi:hypothetical protein
LWCLILLLVYICYIGERVSSDLLLYIIEFSIAMIMLSLYIFIYYNIKGVHTKKMKIVFIIICNNNIFYIKQDFIILQHKQKGSLI